MLSADWISRRLGFGRALAIPETSQTDWLENQRASLRAISKLPFKDSFFTSTGEIEGRGLPEGYFEKLKSTVAAESEGIRLREELWKQEEEGNKRKAAGKPGAREFADEVWRRKDLWPIWYSAWLRGYHAMTQDQEYANRLWFFWLSFFPMGRSSNNSMFMPNFQATLKHRQFGNFADLLYAVVRHPAMLLYLDNDGSVGPNSRARIEKWTDRSYNENLGRELLELYSVTPGAGYTQEDVTAAAFLLTGWTIDKKKLMADFDPNMHQPGPHKVLGKSYGGFSGGNSLKKLCDDLALHPMTARHIATRLCTHFIQDSPSSLDVEKVASVYTAHKGDLLPVYEALLERLEERSPEQKAEKFLAPEIWLWQVMIVRGLKLPPDMYPRNMSAGGLLQVYGLLMDLGQMQGEAPQPNGWPDQEDFWLSNEYLDRRIRLAASAGTGAWNSPSDFLDRSFDRLKIAPTRIAGSDARQNSMSKAVNLFCSPKFLRA